MTLEELKQKMREINKEFYIDVVHIRIDELLLDFINDAEVKALYWAVEKNH